MSTHRATKYGEFFTLFGGIIALSGFCMPWTSISPAYKFFTIRPLNSTSILIIIAFIASVVILSISYYTKLTQFVARGPCASQC